MNARIFRLLLVAPLVLGFCAAALAADSTAPASANGKDAKKVNINQATAEQLAFLPRVGAKAAQRVVDYRKTKGPFARPEDLMEVKGFGEKKFEQLKPYLAVSGPTTLSAKVSSAGSRGASKSSGNGNGKGNSKAKSSKKPASASTAAAVSEDTKSQAAPVGQGR